MGLTLLEGPVDLDIHALECPRGQPNRHLDVRWLAVAPPGAIPRPSDDSPHLRWFRLDQPPADADDSTLRLVRLARSLRSAGMTPEEFRKQGYTLVDWITDYLEGIERHPVASPLEPGWVRSQLPAAPADRAGAVRRRAGRPRPGDRARPHPVAASQLLRLLPGQHQLPGDPGRARGLRAGGQRHVVGHEPGLHRARDADAGLDGGPARPAGPVPLDRRRWRGDPGLGVRGHAVRHPGRPGAGHRRRRQPLRRAAATWSRTRRPRPTRRSRRAIRVAGIGSDNLSDRRPRRRASPCDRRPWRRPSPRTGPRGGGRSSSARPRARPRRPRSTRCPQLAAICRREGLWLHVDAAMSGHRRPAARAALGQRRARRGRLLLHQPAQVDGRQLRLRPVLGGRPVRAAGRRCRSCPSTCARRPARRAR